MEILAWFLAIVLMAAGLLGTVLPIFPGTVFILAAAMLHRVMVGPDKGASWWTIAILAFLMIVSYLIDLLAGYVGAKHFGATRWGMFGAAIGAIVGLFFGLIGLLTGPVIGAIAGEIVGGKRSIQAGRAAWGTLLGNLAGMLAKLILALAMISIFLVTVSAPL